MSATKRQIRASQSLKARATEGPKGGKTTVTSGGLIRVVIYLSPEERKALRLISAYTERSVSEMVREKVQELIAAAKKGGEVPAGVIK